MARNAIIGGLGECVLALGFEKMFTGSLKTFFQDRSNPIDEFLRVNKEEHGETKDPINTQLFGNAGLEHMKKYGSNADHFAKVAEKNHRHSANNPYSQFRDVYTLDEIKNSQQYYGPLTKLQCCPTSDGAAAAIVVSEAYMIKHGLQDQAVEILGMDLRTDSPKTFEGSAMELMGYSMAKKAAENVYKQSGVTPKDV